MESTVLNASNLSKLSHAVVYRDWSQDVSVFLGILIYENARQIGFSLIGIVEESYRNQYCCLITEMQNFRVQDAVSHQH